MSLCYNRVLSTKREVRHRFCLKQLAANINTFHDWKMVRRPGTNRLAGADPLYNWELFSGNTFTMDEVEIAQNTDDLIDVKSDPMYADKTAPQQGLPSDEFYLAGIHGLNTRSIQSGWVLKFRDPTSLVVYATATVTNVASTSNTYSDDGTQEILVTLNQGVTVTPNSFVDCDQYKMLQATVVDSYFHDGDNAGIQIKGSQFVNISNNYTNRMIANSIDRACSELASKAENCHPERSEGSRILG